MKKQNHKFYGQSGQGLIEYLIIVALVAVGTVGIMRVLGQSVQTKFAKISESLGAKVNSPVEQAEVKDSQWKKKDLKNFMQGTLNRSSDSEGDN